MLQSGKEPQMGPVDLFLYSVILCLHYPFKLTIAIYRTTWSIVDTSAMVPKRALNYSVSSARSIIDDVRRRIGAIVDFVKMMISSTLAVFVKTKNTVLYPIRRLNEVSSDTRKQYEQNFYDPVYQREKPLVMNPSSISGFTFSSIASSKQLITSLVEHVFNFLNNTFVPIIILFENSFRYLLEQIRSVLPFTTKQLPKSEIETALKNIKLNVNDSLYTKKTEFVDWIRYYLKLPMSTVSNLMVTKDQYDGEKQVSDFSLGRTVIHLMLVPFYFAALLGLRALHHAFSTANNIVDMFKRANSEINHQIDNQMNENKLQQKEGVAKLLSNILQTALLTVRSIKQVIEKIVTLQYHLLETLFLSTVLFVQKLFITAIIATKYVVLLPLTLFKRSKRASDSEIDESQMEEERGLAKLYSSLLQCATSTVRIIKIKLGRATHIVHQFLHSVVVLSLIVLEYAIAGIAVINTYVRRLFEHVKMKVSDMFGIKIDESAARDQYDLPQSVHDVFLVVRWIARKIDASVNRAISLCRNLIDYLSDLFKIENVENKPTSAVVALRTIIVNVLDALKRFLNQDVSEEQPKPLEPKTDFEIAMSRFQAAALETERLAFRQEIVKLKEEIKRGLKKSTDAHAERHKCNKQINDLQEQLNLIQITYAQQRQLLANEFERERQKYKQEIKNLNEDVSTSNLNYAKKLEEKSRNFESDRLKYEAELGKLQKEIEALSQNKVNDSTNEHDLDDQIHQLQDDNRKLQKTVDNLEKSKEKLRRNNEQLRKAQENEFANERRKLQGEIEKLKKEIERLKGKIADLEKQVGILKKTGKNSWLDERRKLQDEINDLNEQIETLKKKVAEYEEKQGGGLLEYVVDNVQELTDKIGETVWDQGSKFLGSTTN